MRSVRPSKRRDDIALLERRKGLLGRSRVPALAATCALIGVTAILTGLLFAAIANLSAHRGAAPRVTAVPDSQQGLQVIRADPLQLPRVLAFLSAPGRVALNGPAESGVPAVSQGVPLGTAGSLLAGDTLRVCTDLPVPAVQLSLVDRATGALLAETVFANPPLCRLPVG